MQTVFNNKDKIRCCLFFRNKTLFLEAQTFFVKHNKIIKKTSSAWKNFLNSKPQQKNHENPWRFLPFTDLSYF